MLLGTALGQATGFPGVGVTGTPVLDPNSNIPYNWVNTCEYNPPGGTYVPGGCANNPPGGTYDVTCTLGGGTCTGNSNSYADTFAGLQQAICDWVNAPDQWWLIKVPHGQANVITTTSTGYTCTGFPIAHALTLFTKIVSGHLPTKFFTIDSDTPLTVGQTICSHGITDSTGTSQPPSGATSTWWQGSNFGCANDIGSTWWLDGNWTSAGNSGVNITAGAFDATTNLGPSHYAIKNCHCYPDPSLSGFSAFVINTVQVPTASTQVSQDASHIHFVNIYSHGDAIDWASGQQIVHGNNSISSVWNIADCAYCSVEYSYVDYVTRAGAEGHIVQITRSPGPIKIAHNWFSGASIVLLTGGIVVNDPLYYLNDVEVRDNRFTMPPTWWGKSNCSSTYGVPAGCTWLSGQGPFMKNRQEYKVCQRCIIDGNIAEYSDESGSQSGQIFTADPRACSNSLQCDNPQVAVVGLTYSNNIGRHALVAFQFAGRSNYPANGGGVAAPLRNVNVQNNLFYDMGNGANLDPTTIVSNPYFIQPGANGEGLICPGTNVSGLITLNCQVGPTGLKSHQISVGDIATITNCSDSTWNVPSGNFPFTKGATALVGTNPNGMTFVYFNAGAVSSTATNCILNNAEGNPTGLKVIHNTHVATTTLGGKNNERIFSGVTTTLLTDTGCTGGSSGPQNATAITSISRDATGTIVTAVVASTTNWPTALTSGSGQIIAEAVGGTNFQDFQGYFYYLGQSGGNLQWMQIGTPNETCTGGCVPGTAQQMGTCPANNFMQSAVWKDNLFAVDTSASSCPAAGVGWQGWISQGDGNVEGCSGGAGATGCSENQVDTTNSVVTYSDLPGRCGSKYMEVGGAHAGAIPPVTITFPLTTGCSGATADATCVGMTGMMSGAPFDGNDANYHNYVLVNSSVYHNAADDGTDLGANISAIDAAQTTNIYTCPHYCGSPGPWPDH